jgi:hypothetical protein
MHDDSTGFDGDGREDGVGQEGNKCNRPEDAEDEGGSPPPVILHSERDEAAEKHERLNERQHDIDETAKRIRVRCRPNVFV